MVTAATVFGGVANGRSEGGLKGTTVAEAATSQKKEEPKKDPSPAEEDDVKGGPCGLPAKCVIL